jgi:hypothetical protein
VLAIFMDYKLLLEHVFLTEIRLSMNKVDKMGIVTSSECQLQS